jgi:hypothetical protein
MDSSSPDAPKFGAGHAQAWLRAGVKELAQVLQAFPGQGIHPVEEQGLVGNPVSREVYEQKREEVAPATDAAAMTEAYSRKLAEGARTAPPPDRSPPEPGRDMER